MNLLERLIRKNKLLKETENNKKEKVNKKPYNGIKVEISCFENDILQSAEISEKEKEFQIHNLMYRDGEIEAEYEEKYDDYE